MKKLEEGRSAKMFLPLFAITVFIILSSASAKANTREEALYTLRAERVASETVVYLSGDTVFIPFDDFLAFLKIYNTVDERRVYKGYVNTRDSSFTIDFYNNTFMNINGVTKDIPAGAYFIESGMIYANTDLLKDCFQVEMKPSYNRLSVPISASYELPVFRSLKAEFKSNNFRREFIDDSLAPILYDRSFKILNGGTLDYSLNMNAGANARSYNGVTTLGMQVLGGATQYTISGAYNQNKFAHRENYRWTYTLDNCYLNSLSLGDLYTTARAGTNGKGYSKPSYQIRGIQITNENQSTPVGFSNIIVEERIEPDWNIELYVDNRLYDAKKTDPTGYYRFELPIKYGSNQIIVKKYGPKGEYEEEDKSVSVTNEFLSPGKTYYGANFGVDKTTNKYLFDGAFSMGVTDWFTGSFSGNKLDKTKDYVLLSNLNFQLFSDITLRTMLTNAGAYEAELRIPRSFLGGWNFSYTSFDPTIYKERNMLGNIQASGQFGRIFGLPFGLGINGSRKYMDSGSSDNTAYLNLSTYLFGISFSGMYNMSVKEIAHKYGEISQSATGNLSYSLEEYRGVMSLFSQLRLNLSGDYNPTTKEFGNIGLNVSKNIFKSLYLTFNYTYNCQSKYSIMNFSLNLNTDYIRSSGSMAIPQTGDPTYNANIAGAVDFDPTNMKFRMLSSLGGGSNFGKSSAAVKFFVDRNFNGKFDDDIEKIIPEVKINVTNEMATRTNEDDCILLTNLIPGRRYNVRVNTESFNNPAIIPDYNEFSFIADPYTCKAIDIPCRPGGMIEGGIKYKSDKEERGQGGVRVHVRSKSGGFETSIAVFSDGSYFYLGVPVGEYEVFVDSMQLAVLRCNSVPAKIDLSVKATADGDYIGNLNFTLTPREAGAPRAGDEPLADASVGAKSLRSMSGSPLQSVGQPVGKPLPPETKNDTLMQAVTPSPSMTKKLDKGFLFEKPKAFSGQKRGDFKPSSDLKAYLESLAEYMATNKNCTVSIIGHTDSFGSFAQNTEDAKGRSQAAAEYLISKGIAKTRIYTTSKGALAPVETNDTEEGRAKNRRVEIQVLK